MAFVPFIQAVEVKLNFLFEGQETILTLGVSNTGAITVSGMTALANAIIAWCATNLMTRLSDEITFESVTVTDLTSSSSPSILVPAPSPVPGSAAASTPSNAALVVTFVTASRGRSYRGRNYTPAIPVAQTDSSLEVKATYLANILAAYAALPAALPSGWTHVILSRFASGVARVLGVKTPVTAYTGNKAIDSQRRRLEGRGR